MQKVSQEWKDNQNELLVSESFVELSLKLTDPDAYEDATATSTEKAYYSNDANYLVSEVDKKVEPYATLERNLWLLDGSRKIIPASDYGEAGFVSNRQSVSTGVFNYKPLITINFSQVFTELITGVTITWSTVFEEYATDFIVTAYNNNKVVATSTVTNNTELKLTVYMDIINYNKITVEVLKWSQPWHRARITSIQIGTDLIYTKSDIITYSHSQEVDPISAKLPISKISFAINNVDDSFNPNNGDSLAKYLMARQEIKVKYGYKLNDKVEWIDSGTFYMSEWDAPQNGLSADFTARDLLEFMSGTYYKGLYNPSYTTLYDLAIDVLQDADLPLDNDGVVKWVVDEKLKQVRTVAPLPIDSHANCLQMIANAGGCVIYQDRKGLLHIEKLITSETDYNINHFNSYSKSDISLSKPLKQVDVSCYSYSYGEEVSELYNGKVNVKGTTDIIITYSSPATNVTASVVGGTLNSATYYTNACVVNITGNGEVAIAINGYTLNSSTAIITTSYDVKGEIVSVDNPLICEDNQANAIGKWVGDYMKNRMVLSSNWRSDPRLDALDIVENENDYNSNKVIMTSVEYSYNGAFRAKGEGRVI